MLVNETEESPETVQEKYNKLILTLVHEHLNEGRRIFSRNDIGTIRHSQTKKEKKKKRPSSKSHTSYRDK